MKDKEEKKPPEAEAPPEIEEMSKLEEELKKLRQELDEHKQQYLRVLAEYDNFRKRTAKALYIITQSLIRSRPYCQ